MILICLFYYITNLFSLKKILEMFVFIFLQRKQNNKQWYLYFTIGNTEY